MKLVLAILIAIFLTAPTLLLGAEPTIHRLGRADLIRVPTMVRFTTLIILSEGEEIAEVTCGDSSYWVIEASKGSTAVHVKPAKEGAVTNINIVSKSGAVYSFLLEEVSGIKGRPAKGRPDLIVRVNPEDLSQLRKDKENLTEALSRTERQLKAEKERAAEVERKRSLKKDEPAQSPGKEAEVNKPDLLIRPAKAPPAQALPTQSARPPASQPKPESEFKVYVAKKHGILENGGRAVGDVLRKVGSFLWIF